MSRTIEFGILGAARIARKALVPALIQSGSARLAALSSNRPGVARDWAFEIARSHLEKGLPKSYDSYDALLADPEIEAVYIPATGNLHHSLTLQAAEAGKHVLCEKSLATSVKEAQEMVQACQLRGVLLQEAFMWRHHPRTRKAMQLLQENAIGELRIICAHFSFDIDRGDWRLNPEKGGGALWDIGCYGVNAARLFSGSEPDIIHAQARFSESGVDMTTQIALTFPGDIMANIDCSFETAYRCEVELAGSKGRIVLPRAFSPEECAELHLYRDARGIEPPEIVRFPPANQYLEMVDHFCHCIRQGELLRPAENGLANMQVLEQALAIA